MTEFQKVAQSTWWEVSLEVPSAIADDASASLISGGALGVQIIDGSVEPLPMLGRRADHSLLVANYADDGEQQQLVQDAVDALTELGLTISPTAVRTAHRTGGNWAERWKQYFKPLKVGRRLWIIPSWDKFTPPTGSIPMTLDPGMAFGTGQHGTTMLCLKAIELYADKLTPEGRRAATLLDVGTGSGILAIGAVKLGLGSAVGIDNDPEVIQIATDNVAANHVSAQVTIAHQTIAAVGRKFDMIVANILANPLIEMGEELLRALNPNGVVVLSGLLTEQTGEVIRAYENAAKKLKLDDFQHQLRWTHREWAALRFGYGGRL